MAAGAVAGIGLSELAPHRTIVRWGFVISLVGFVATLIAIVLGPLVVGDLLVSTLVLTVFATQEIRARPNALVALLGAASVMVAVGRWALDSESAAASFAGLIVLLVAAAMVVPPFDKRFFVFGLALITAAFVWWPRLGTDPVQTIVSLLAAFVLGSFIVFHSVDVVSRVARRYADLYRLAPAGLIEEDWTDALAYLRQNLAPDEDLLDRLSSDLSFLEEVIGRARVVDANELACRLLSKSSADLIGPVQIKDWAPLDESTWPAEIAAIAAGERFESRHHDAPPDGPELWLDIVSVPAGNRVMVGIVDVTEAERARLELEDGARSKDRFIAAVSHELRTPLAAILGFSQILFSDRDLSEAERREMLEFISTESSQVAWVLEDLLVTARTEGGALTVKSSATDLGSIVADVARDIPGLEVLGSVAGWSAIADPGRLRHLVRNLFMNAVEHGGPVRRAVMGRTGDVLFLEVRDSGSPLSAHDHERIFSAYETAHDRPGLTASVGLGLAVARRLARLMDGDLDYFHDGEAVFRLTIPGMEVGRGSLGLPSRPRHEVPVTDGAKG